MSGIVPRTNAYAGYYNQETRLPSSVPISSLEEAYTPGGFEWWDWAKTKPKIITTPGGKTINVAGAKEIETTPPDFVKMPLPTEGKSKDPEVKTGDKTIDMSTPVVSDEDTIKSYMSMFQEALGTDQDDITRDKYLQLAKFGANLMAQPGGDLAGAIGKAAAPSIEGLAKTQAVAKAADREVKLAAIKTAIDKMDDPTLDKIKSLAKAADMPIQEVAKSFVTTAQEGKTKESIITTNQEAMEGEIGKGPALKAARTMAEAGLNFALFDKLPVDKDGKIKPDTPNGYYYDEKGNLSIVKDGVKSDIKFKAKE
tara:strand:- start:2103 stop:3035 length:933 start_codon:yes stop_codon:yes gene_type:complete